MAFSVIDDFTSQMISTIETTGQSFGPADLRAFLEHYKREQTSSPKSVYKAQFQHCQIRHEQEIFDRSRKEPFKRVILMPISVWFPPDGGMADEETFLSRRMIQGFFKAIEKMGSYSKYAHGHEVCIKTTEKLKDKENGQLFWEDLYNHPEVIEAADDLIMSFVPHFDDLHKRAEWLRTLINSNLAPFESYIFEGERSQQWRMDEHETLVMLRSLFSHLGERLNGEGEMHSVVERYGEKDTRALASLICALNHPGV